MKLVFCLNFGKQAQAPVMVRETAIPNYTLDINPNAKPQSLHPKPGTLYTLNPTTKPHTLKTPNQFLHIASNHVTGCARAVMTSSKQWTTPSPQVSPYRDRSPTYPLKIRIWGFPKIRGTLFGDPHIRIIVWWGPPILRNYHICKKSTNI